jgi:hypothetical protein
VDIAPGKAGILADLVALYDSCDVGTGAYTIELISGAQQNTIVEWLGEFYQVPPVHTCLLTGQKAGICTRTETMNSMPQT